MSITSITRTFVTQRRRLLELTDKLAGLAPLLIRVTVASIFIPTGWAKLNTLPQVTEYFAGLGIPLPGLNAAVVASTEFAGGILLLMGLGSRLVALPLAVTMVVAIITAKRDEIAGWRSVLGFEEWSYLVMFLVIALAGPGPLSLDAVIAKRLHAGPEAPPARPLLPPDSAPAPQG